MNGYLCIYRYVIYLSIFGKSVSVFILRICYVLLYYYYWYFEPSHVMIVTDTDQWFYVRGRTSWRGVWGPPSSPAGTGQRTGAKPLGIRKYRTSFLNRNWLKLYHVRHDAPHRRYVQWSMLFYSWRKALLRLQYEKQQSRLLLVPGKYVWFCSMHITLYPFAQKRKN